MSEVHSLHDHASVHDVVFHSQVETLASTLLSRCHSLGLSLGTAESCTAGMIASALGNIPGASQSFKGSIISYVNQIKRDVLGVPEEVLSKYGAVSREVATHMSSGLLHVLDCDLSIAITGLAGPDGDDFGNPVGLIYVNIARPTYSQSFFFHLKGNRQEIRQEATLKALQVALGVLDIEFN